MKKYYLVAYKRVPTGIVFVDKILANSVREVIDILEELSPSSNITEILNIAQLPS